MKNFNIFNIKTTAYSEEDFTLVTDLTKEQISKVIEPMVLAERNDEKVFYDNLTYVKELNIAYPNNTATIYDEFETETIEF